MVRIEGMEERLAGMEADAQVTVNYAPNAPSWYDPIGIMGQYQGTSQGNLLLVPVGMSSQRRIPLQYVRAVDPVRKVPYTRSSI